MSEASENAVLRIMLRQMAPKIKEAFIAASEEWSHSVYVLYMTMGYRQGADLNNPKDAVILIRSTMDKNKIGRGINHDNKDSDAEDQLKEMFPVASAIIMEYAEAWKIKNPENVFLNIKLKPGKDINSVDSIVLSVKEKRRKDPSGNYLEQREEVIA